MNRRIRMPGDVAGFVRTLHPQLKRKVKAALQAILDDSQAGKALKQELAGLRSFRVGNFRVVYGIPKKGDVIDVVAVGPCRNIYEESLRLMKKER